MMPEWAAVMALSAGSGQRKPGVEYRCHCCPDPDVGAVRTEWRPLRAINTLQVWPDHFGRF